PVPEARHRQLELSTRLVTALGEATAALQGVRKVRADAAKTKGSGPAAATAAAPDAALTTLEEAPGEGLASLNEDLLRLYEIVQGADAAPTAAVVAAVE